MRVISRYTTQFTNSAVTCGVVAMLVAAFFSLLWLRKHNFDVAQLVVAGDQFSDPHLVPRNLPVENRSAGYDGQFYYRLALNPFTRQVSEFGIRLDYPIYRQQRILFPFLAWLISAGHPAAVPGAFLAINLLSIGLLGWAAARIAQSYGAAPFWGVAMWLYPGWPLTLARDCVELLEIALLACMVLALIRDHVRVATVLAIAAVFTKETALLGVIGCLVVFAFCGELRKKSAYATVAVITTSAYAVFKYLLFWAWHAPVRLGTGIFGAPLNGVLRAARSLACSATTVDRWYLLEILGLFVLTYLCIRMVRASRAWPLAIVAACYGLMLVSLDQTVWIEDWAFLRASAEYCFFCGCIIAGSSRIWRTIGTVFVIGFWTLITSKLLFLLE